MKHCLIILFAAVLGLFAAPQAQATTSTPEQVCASKTGAGKTGCEYYFYYLGWDISQKQALERCDMACTQIYLVQGSPNCANCKKGCRYAYDTDK